MCIFHKWGKWVEHVEEMVSVNMKTGIKHDYLEKRQKRICEKCGKVEDIRINLD